jgi:hypothetical protein
MKIPKNSTALSKDFAQRAATEWVVLGRIARLATEGRPGDGPFGVTSDLGRGETPSPRSARPKPARG